MGISDHRQVLYFYKPPGYWQHSDANFERASGLITWILLSFFPSCSFQRLSTHVSYRSWLGLFCSVANFTKEISMECLRSPWPRRHLGLCR